MVTPTITHLPGLLQAVQELAPPLRVRMALYSAERRVTLDLEGATWLDDLSVLCDRAAELGEPVRVIETMSPWSWFWAMPGWRAWRFDRAVEETEELLRAARAFEATWPMAQPTYISQEGAWAVEAFRLEREREALAEAAERRRALAALMRHTKKGRKR